MIIMNIKNEFIRDRVVMYAALSDDIELLYVCCIIIIVDSPLAGHCHQTLSE